MTPDAPDTPEYDPLCEACVALYEHREITGQDCQCDLIRRVQERERATCDSHDTNRVSLDCRHYWIGREDAVDDYATYATHDSTCNANLPTPTVCNCTVAAVVRTMKGHAS